MMESFTPTGAFFPATIKVKQQKCFFQPRKRPRDMGVSAPKVSKGRSESPLVASAEARFPAFREKPSIIGKTSYMVAPIWRDTAQMLERAAWGRFCGSAKLLAGTLRCLHLVGDFLGVERPKNCWGVAPNPTRELRPLTPQGGFPLDPFLAPRLERASHAVPFWGFLPFFLTGTRT